MCKVISRLLYYTNMAWQIIKSRSLAPLEFIESSHLILDTLKSVTNQEIWKDGDKQPACSFSDYSIYKLRYYPRCFFVIDDADTCVIGAIIESQFHGLFCFHFLTNETEHIKYDIEDRFDITKKIANDNAVSDFFTHGDPMNSYLEDCQDKTDTFRPYTALKINFSSPIEIENTVAAHFNTPDSSPKAAKTDILYLMETLSPWKETTRRAVFKVLYKGQVCALKLFVLRGHSDQYNDSQFLHEAKIYEDVQLTNAAIQNHILHFFGFGTIQSFNLDCNSTFCFHRKNDNPKTWIFSCFILTEFIEQTLDSILDHNPDSPYGRQLMQNTISSINTCNAGGLQHNDIKLDNIFVDKELNVKIGDFDLSTYKPVYLGMNPFYRYSSCETYGLGSSENPWTDIFKFLMLMALHYTQHLTAYEWDKVVFVQPAHKNKCFTDLQRLQLKSGQQIDAWMKNYNLMTLNLSSEKKGYYTTLENSELHAHLVSQLMAPVQTILDVLKCNY